MKQVRILVFAIIVAFAITKNTKVYVDFSTAHAETETVSQPVAPAPVAAVAAAPAAPSAVDQAVAPPGWLKAVIAYAVAVPTIGPIVVEILKWIGVLASLLTALSSLLIATNKAFEAAGKVWGEFSKVKAFLDKAIYYVGYLSVFNVRKDEDNKTKIS
jgi:hypothetical protein